VPHKASDGMEEWKDDWKVCKNVRGGAAVQRNTDAILTARNIASPKPTPHDTTAPELGGVPPRRPVSPGPQEGINGRTHFAKLNKDQQPESYSAHSGGK